MRASYSENELRTVDAWAARAKQERGFNDTDEVGKALLQTCGDQPITEASLESAAAAMQQAGWDVFRSKAQLAFQAVFAKLDAKEQAFFQKYWRRQERTLVVDGDKGFANATKVLEINLSYGWGINEEGMNRAVQYAMAHMGMVNAQKSDFQGGIHSNNPKLQKDEVPLSERLDTHGRPLYKREPSLASTQWEEKVKRDEAAGRAPTVAESVWEAKANDVRGNLNSTTEAVQRLFVTRQDRSIDWQATYKARYEFAGQSGDGRASGSSR